MQPAIKAQLDSLVANCSDDETRKELLASTGTQAILSAYARIVSTMAAEAPRGAKLHAVAKYIVNTSELLAYVNDQIILYGYGDITGYDRPE